MSCMWASQERLSSLYIKPKRFANGGLVYVGTIYTQMATGQKTKKMNFSELFSHYISFMSAQSERRSYLDRDLWKTVPATLFNNLCNSYWSLPDTYS